MSYRGGYNHILTSHAVLFTQGNTISRMQATEACCCCWWYYWVRLVS